MKNYMFHTSVTMKEYNRKNYWIDRDYIPTFTTVAETLDEAMTDFVAHCKEHFIDISKTALAKKCAMYVDRYNGEQLETMQRGYVITGKTEIQKDDYTWSTQYVDLWVAVDELKNVFAA